jgi:thiamine-phosphate pyrophosphorylase
MDRRERLRGARLYLICEDRPDEFLERALRGGVDIVQLRIKHGSDEAILDAARRFRALTARHRALFILNDRPDLAAQADADGVHVGQDDAPAARARATVGPDRLVGLSTHSPAQIDAATTAGVDYIGVGPVYATPTKPGRPAVGLDLVRYAAARARTPFFAIGGINPENIDAVREAGATRVAVVRALTEAAEPEQVAATLRRPTEVAVGRQ